MEETTLIYIRVPRVEVKKKIRCFFGEQKIYKGK